MQGVPRQFNTRHDVKYSVNLAMNGKLEAADVKKRLEAMLNTETHWVFKAVVDKLYTPAENEKVLQQETGGVVEHICFELQDNPGGLFIRLGLSRPEVENMINQL